MDQYQKTCRYFSGYKPCGKNDHCDAQCAQKKEAHPRILIIHLGAHGAVLRSTCILPPLIRQWPQVHATWVTSTLCRPLLENNPLIDRLLTTSTEDLLQLSVLEFDYIFCLDKSLVAAGVIKIPARVGEIKGFRGDEKTGCIVPANSAAVELYEIGLSDRQKFFVNRKPETQLITEALDLKFQRDPYVYQFTEEELVERDQLRREWQLTNQPVIGLNTGCSNVIPNKKLSVEGWVKLITKIHMKHPRSPLLLLGGPEDTQRNIQIHGRCEAPTFLTPTTEGLRKGILLMDLCDVVVTGDSLGMHMALALKKWVIGWFGPTCAHEIDFFDRGVPILTKAGCSPCWKRECSKDPMCYDLVDFDQIVAAISARPWTGLQKPKPSDRWTEDTFCDYHESRAV